MCVNSHNNIDECSIVPFFTLDFVKDIPSQGTKTVITRIYKLTLIITKK